MIRTVRQIIDDLIESINYHGEMIIAPGVFVQTHEELENDRQTWCDEDPYKHMDTSAAPYWIVTDNGTEPMPIQDANELYHYAVDVLEMTGREPLWN